MDDLFTIVFDPKHTGDFRLYDRVFYIDSSVPYSRVIELNCNNLFTSYKVARVSFTFLNFD